MPMKAYMTVARQFLARDIKAWTFYPTSWISNLLEALSQVALSFLFAQFMIATGHPFGENYFSFRVLAVLSGAWLSVTLNSGHNTIREAYWSRQLETVLISPMPITLYIVASSIWGYVLATINVSIFLALALVFGYNIYLGGNFLLAIVAIILSNVATFGYSLIAASNVFIFKAKAGGTGPTPTTLILWCIIAFASGNLYPLHFLPTWIQWLSTILPHTLLYDAVRRMFLTQGILDPLLIHNLFPFDPVATDILVLVMQICILIPIGYKLLRFSMDKAQREGDLTRWV